MPPHGPNIVTKISKVIIFLFTLYSATGGLFALQTNSMTTKFNHMSSFHISVYTSNNVPLQHTSDNDTTVNSIKYTFS
jgi:hypothetical protein